MKNTNLLIGAGVVVVGYLLYKNMKNNQSNLAECTKEVEKQIANTMFKTGANFNMNEYKKRAIDKCLQNKTKDTQLGQKLNVPMTLNIDVNTIPDEFTIKSDGYNTTYQRGFMAGGNKGLIYWKKPYKLNSDSGVQPINIEVDEFKKAYNEFLKQPK